MNKIFLLAPLISVTGYSQLKYATGGAVYGKDEQKIKPIAVRELMKDNTQALALYNVGRRKKTFGNVLFYGGFGLAAFNLVSAAYKSPEMDGSGHVSNDVGPELAIIGGAMVLASIPIKLGYTKKVKAAIDQYNGDVAFNDKPTPIVNLLANKRGFGISIQF